MNKACAAGAKVPRAIDCGNIDGASYLLMTKLPGKHLSEDWHLLAESERESLIAQIVEQLKIFHNISFGAYSSMRPREFANWENALDFLTNIDRIDQSKLDAETRKNFVAYSDFYKAHKGILKNSSAPVLVHNDFHFENILHDGDTLTGIIDFDFARQAPKDYELWHMLDFFLAPKYYVEEKTEPLWEHYRLGNEISLFKKYYPELFAGSDLVTRLRLYMGDVLVSSLDDGAFGKFNEKFGTYCNTDWLERVISS